MYTYFLNIIRIKLHQMRPMRQLFDKERIRHSQAATRWRRDLPPRKLLILRVVYRKVGPELALITQRLYQRQYRQHTLTARDRMVRYDDHGLVEQRHLPQKL